MATLVRMQRNVLCNSLAIGCHHEEIVGKLGASRISFQWYGHRAAVARGIFSKLYKFIYSQRARIVLMVILLLIITIHDNTGHSSSRSEVSSRCGDVSHTHKSMGQFDHLK